MKKQFKQDMQYYITMRAQHGLFAQETIAAFDNLVAKHGNLEVNSWLHTYYEEEE
jgi:hypothetical protein